MHYSRRNVPLQPILGGAPDVWNNGGILARLMSKERVGDDEKFALHENVIDISGDEPEVAPGKAACAALAVCPSLAPTSKNVFTEMPRAALSRLMSRK
jgi:hypothetical protein